MNWRAMLFLYTAKVAEEYGDNHLANQLRFCASNVPAMDGGGFRILRVGDLAYSGRIYQAFPEELPFLGDYEIAFVTPLESVTEERLYVRPVEPDWMRK